MTDPTTPTPQIKEQVTDQAADVKERAGQAMDAGKHGAADVGRQAGDSAREVAGEAARQARDLMGEARSQVTQQAGDQHQKLVQSLRTLSDELASMTQNSGQSGVATELVSQAQERVQGLTDWLADKQPGDLLQEARRFARNRPGTFLIGAALAGVVAGRMTRGVVAAHSDSSGQSNGARHSAAAPPVPTTPPATTATYPEPAAAAAGYQPTGDHGGLA
jgi:hypothetical protein